MTQESCSYAPKSLAMAGNDHRLLESGQEYAENDAGYHAQGVGMRKSAR